jgi:hypothetical protein
MDGENNQMHLYHYGSNASMTYQIIDKFIPDLFAEGGQVSLADWNPSTTSDKHLVVSPWASQAIIKLTIAFMPSSVSDDELPNMIHCCLNQSLLCCKTLPQAEATAD